MNKNISSNTKFILNGTFSSQSTIKTLNIDHPIYLTSRNHKVKLDVEEILEGMNNITQALLKPSEDLIVGESYNLHIDEDELKRLSHWDAKKRMRVPMRLTVSKEKDTVPPLWDHIPRFKENLRHAYYNGLAVWSIFEFGVVDSTPIIILTELHNNTTNEMYSQYLHLDINSELYIGHNQCYGSFTFLKDNQYEVRFKLMDYSGNKDKYWTDWIPIENPMNKIKR